LPAPGAWPGGRSSAVAERETGPAVARLAAIDRRDGVSELGYLVVRGRQGEAIAREALTALIDHLITSSIAAACSRMSTLTTRPPIGCSSGSASP